MGYPLIGSLQEYLKIQEGHHQGKTWVAVNGNNANTLGYGRNF